MSDDHRARQMLAGPRGRRLCAELLTRPDGGAGAPWWFSGTPDRVTALADLRSALARTDLDDVAQPERLDEALQESVDRAMYWQPPDEVDSVLADVEVATVLAPVAAAVVRAAGSQWWTEPLEPGTQHAVGWPRGDAALPDRPRTSGARTALEAWRESELAEEARAARERPADPRASWSGAWWSTPTLAGLVVTTRSRREDRRSGAGISAPLDVPVRLTLVEDELGWKTARTWPVHPPRKATVYEVTGPDAWTALVERYPLDVSASKRHDWWRVTGWDGSWAMPDWAAVSTEFDAVHLTVDGYLSTAGRALPIDVPGPPARTVLSGWDPDATWWLTDVLPALGEATDWRRRDDEPPRWEPVG